MLIRDIVRSSKHTITHYMLIRDSTNLAYQKHDYHGHTGISSITQDTNICVRVFPRPEGRHAASELVKTAGRGEIEKGLLDKSRSWLFSLVCPQGVVAPLHDHAAHELPRWILIWEESHTRTHKHMHTLTHTYTYIYSHTRTDTHTRIHTHTHTYTRMYTQIRTHTHTCIYTWACTHAPWHTHTHIHTHIQIPDWLILL